MCLNQRFVRSQSRNLSTGKPFIQVQKCGHCAECIAEKRDEWYFRTWYESQSCVRAGGYVLFDTLTYRDEDVPHMSDFIDYKKLHLSEKSVKYNYMCFSRDDIALFFKRLRRQLAYLGYKDSDAFKYFLTSEYGTSDSGTHRPHYHVLFFVKDANLPPLTFSKLIDKCWQKGRTDGVTYKGSNYVLGKRVFKDFTNKNHLLSTCMYVAKYVTKDFRFRNKVEHRIKYIMNRVFGRDWYKKVALNEDISVFNRYEIQDADEEIPWNSEFVGRDVLWTAKDIQKFYKKLIGIVDQFHLQSNGFGADFLEYNDIDEVMETGLIRMPSKNLNNPYKYLQLPRYYQVRLFYDLHRDFNNHLTYELNDKGIKYKKLRQERALETLTTKLEDWRINMYCCNYYCDLPHDAAQDWYVKNIREFDTLNNGRDLRDFVKYLIYYKGRIKSKEQLEREKDGIYQCDPLSEWIDKIYRNVGPDDVLYNYASSVDEEVLGTKFISKKYYGDSESWANGFLPNIESLLKLEGLAPNWFQEWYVISDSSDSSFANYDRMFTIWCNCQKYKNKFRQQSFDGKEQIRQKFKELNTIAKIL